jgi:hypothetical protein
MVFKADERIYVNADRSAVVPEDSPDAAFLLVGEGGELPDEDAAKYGLTKRERTEAKAEADETNEQTVTRTPTRARTEGK